MKIIKQLGVAILLFLDFTNAQAQTASPFTVLGITGSAGFAANQFDNPAGIFVATDGNVFVADKNNNRISVWTQNGNTFTPLTTFGGFGLADDQIGTPSSVFKASNGYIYVTDQYNYRISVWTQSGNTFGHLVNFGDGTFFNNPISTKAAADGNIYVVDNYNNRISVWTLSGGVFGNLTTFGTNGYAINEFNQPTDIAFTTDGKILVADAANDRISVWANTGNVFSALTTFGGTGAGASQLSSPWGITVAPDNKVYIADLSNQRISIWTTSGLAFGKVTFLGTSGISGSGNNQFSDPSGVFVSSSNTIYVADLYNHRVSVWETCSAPQITHQPTSQTICGSNLATFGVTATGTSLTYTWWNVTNGVQPVATTLGFSTSVAGSYFALATGACGSVYSDVITLTSNPVTAISNQPNSQSICDNIAAILGVTATGANLSYLWSNGATSQTIQTSVAGSYMVTIAGICGTVISNAANLTNGGNSTQIVTQPSSQTLCAGNAATFGVTATGSSLVYLWNNGATTQSIQTSIAGSYMVTVSGACGSVVSNNAQVSFFTPPTITGISEGTVIVPGLTTANLSVTAMGVNLQYFWSNGATTKDVNSVGAGKYTVTIIGQCGLSVVSGEVLVGNLLIATSTSGYTFQRTFGSKGNAANQFSGPSGISIGADGRIYIVNYDLGKISVWTQTGTTFNLVTTFGSRGTQNNQFDLPRDIHVAQDGKIYICDDGNKRISVWSLNGNTYTPVTTFGGYGLAANQFLSTYGITTSQDGKLYVADPFNSKVSIWTPNGNSYNLFATFGTKGLSANKFDTPTDVAIGNDGKIYVLDRGKNRVSVWTQNGNTYTHFDNFGGYGIELNSIGDPYRIDIFENKIYISEVENHRVSVWTHSGGNFGNLTSFGSFGSGNANFRAPAGVAFKDKNIFVAEFDGNRISVWKQPAPISFLTVLFDITEPTTFTGNTATLTWPTITGAFTYCIRISKDRTMGTGVKTVCGLTGNSYKYNPNDPNGRTEAGLEEYFWQVAGVDAEGNESQWSEIQQFSLDATATSTNSSIYQPTNVSIYPNPSANGEFRMENGEYVTITDVVGKEILSTTKSTFTIATKGIFIARVKTKFGITTLKLVVE